ncbi:MAG TPA: hypothetical protein VFG51_01460 [Candidatus Saccharimonadia bacterium]|nr:hypothetical protein [Candidatus Saccharimonadia bacterium]
MTEAIRPGTVQPEAGELKRLAVEHKRCVEAAERAASLIKKFADEHQFGSPFPVSAVTCVFLLSTIETQANQEIIMFFMQVLEWQSNSLNPLSPNVNVSALTELLERRRKGIQFVEELVPILDRLNAQIIAFDTFVQDQIHRNYPSLKKVGFFGEREQTEVHHFVLLQRRTGLSKKTRPLAQVAIGEFFANNGVRYRTQNSPWGK